MVDGIEITGGAGPHLAAAIAAVVEAVDKADREALATRPKPIKPTLWVQAGRQPEWHAPVSSAEYDRTPNGTNGGTADHNGAT